MRLKLLAVFITILSLILGSGGEALASPPSPEGSAQPAVTTLADGLQLDWQIPTPQIKLEPDGRTHILLQGFTSDQPAGSPDIPAASVMIALPPDASPEITTSDQSSYAVTLAEPLANVSMPEMSSSGASPLDENPLATPSFTPGQASLVELKELGDMRGVRLAQLTIHPILADDSGLQITSHVKVEIRFNSTSNSRLPADQTTLAALKDLVINPEQISASLPKVSPNTTSSPDVQPPTAAIEVASEGIYRVTFSALSGIGFPIGSIDPQKLHLSRAGVDIPYELEANSLVFYAKPRTSRWTNNDVYFLTAGSAPGPAIPTLNAAKTNETSGIDWFEQTYEINRYYTPDCKCAPVPLNRDGDRWVWDSIGIKRGSQNPVSQSFDSPASISINANNAQTAHLTVWLIGYTSITNVNPDHWVQVSLNDNSPFSPVMEWDGKQAVQQTFTIPNGILRATNNLNLTLPGIPGVDIEGAWLDAYSIKYQPGSAPFDGEATFTGSGGSGKYYQVYLSSVAGLRIYDVTQPDAPVRLTNPGINGTTVSFADKNGRTEPRFEVVTDAKIKSPALIRMAKPLRTQGKTGADLIIITPNRFDSTNDAVDSAINGLQSLVSLRQSQGLATEIEDVQAIYDNFSGGLPLPEAIHAFLQSIDASWRNPRPQYVLLVGDGSVDPKRYYSNSYITFIPPFLADFDPYATEGATDNRYVTFGGPNDIIPDMKIGRLPVKTLAELNTVVSKIVQYENAPAPGNWKGNATFYTAKPDAGDFTVAATAEASLLKCTVPTEKLFFPTPYTTGQSVRDALINQWNNGTGLIVFNGHASVHFTGTYDLSGNFFQYFHYNDIANLTNGAKLPVVMEMTCLTGAYQTPGLTTLDEGLVLAPNGGALAVLGASGPVIPVGNEYIAGGFIRALISQNPARLGQALEQGKLQLLADKPSDAFLVDSFNLLGDPSSIFAFDNALSCLYVPSVRR